MGVSHLTALFQKSSWFAIPVATALHPAQLGLKRQMVPTPEHGSNTRMIFMGDAQLADGFRLIGFETWADPSFEEVERLVRDLIMRRQNAFLVVDRRIAEAELPSIQRVRREGGRIVVTPVPPLNKPESFHMRIDDRLQAIFAATGSQSH